MAGICVVGSIRALMAGICVVGILGHGGRHHEGHLQQERQQQCPDNDKGYCWRRACSGESKEIKQLIWLT